jgi:outer membrane protein assembly factor BamB
MRNYAPAVYRPQFLSDPPRMIAHLLIFLTITTIALQAAGPAWWPQFRGENAGGIGDGAPQQQWDVGKKEHLLWKRAIPGLSLASPVVWGDHVFVITAASDKDDAELKIGLYGDIESVTSEDGVKHDWRVFCLNRLTGEPVWEKTVLSAVPASRRHPKSSHANSTPATDGDALVGVFNETLTCLDAKTGDVRWRMEIGPLRGGYFRAPEDTWGYASSPILRDGRVIVQCDVEKQSWIAAFSLKDGKELWRTPRNNKPSWATPSTYTHNGRHFVVANGYERIAGYELETGKEVWHVQGGGDIPVPAPVVKDGLIAITNAHGRLAPVFVIGTDASGDLAAADAGDENKYLRWLLPRRGNYMQTPLLLDARLYLCNDAGVATCLDAATGEEKWRERLGDGSTGFTASPVAAGGLLYWTAENGRVVVVKAADKFERLAENDLGEPCMASPAVADGTLFFRTRRHIMAVK